jgi:flagellar biosynthetic protein FliR
LFALGLPAGVLAGIAALILAAPVIYEQLAGIVVIGLEQTEQAIFG